MKSLIGAIFMLLGIGVLYGLAIFSLIPIRGFESSFIICSVLLALGLIGSCLFFNGLTNPT